MFACSGGAGPTSPYLSGLDHPPLGVESSASYPPSPEANVDARRHASPLVATRPTDVLFVSEGVGAHRAVRQRPLARHHAGLAWESRSRQWSITAA
jgi:hypothetical protein